MSIRNLVMLVALGVCTGLQPALADPDPTPDPDAAVVFLRSNCGPPGSEKSNCFETMESLASVDPASLGWIWAVRQPDASAPLLVDIGLGSFGPFTCDGGSDVSLRGAGPENTILSGQIGAELVECDRLRFLSLGVHGTAYGASWTGSGGSSWSNVDFVSTGSNQDFAVAGWIDACSPGSTETGNHDFYASRIRTAGVGTWITSAVISNCAKSRFYAGEIFMDISGAARFATGVFLGSTGLPGATEFRAYGTAFRSRVTGDVLANSLTGIDVGYGVTFESHGSIVNTSVAPGVASPIRPIGISVRPTGVARTHGTAFTLNAGPGAVPSRLVRTGTGQADSPFLWPPGATPPKAAGEANVLASLDGMDVFVETDCDASGDCAGAGSETHMMVYNAALCGTANPWFDSTTRACRQ